MGLLWPPALINAQPLASLQGRIVDTSGAIVRDAVVRVRNEAGGFDTSVHSDDDGRYYVLGIPSGTYTVVAEARGFRPVRLQGFNLDVGRTLVQDFRLDLASLGAEVTVNAEMPLIDRASATLGHVVTPQIIQSVPLNGRHFIDLTMLVPGSVAPSQTGFSSRPIRGVGALALNAGGNREEAIGFVVNGVTTNNLTFGSLIFEPPLASIDEFKADTSVFAAEYGHVSGGIVNVVTRSGSDRVRGEGFEFLRNEALDARNFFELTSSRPHQFRRHQFGASLGGPIWRRRTLFFVTYEGLRQRQAVDLNSLVLSDAQRAAVTDPAIRQLLRFIPRANVINAAGTPRFVGSAPARADSDRGTLDLRHSLGSRDRVHLFYGAQHVRSVEPTAQGNSIPGFGSTSHPSTSLLTIEATHVFGGTATNEARLGRTHLNGGTFPAAALNPADFGVANGVTSPIGLPQIIVAGDLNFGGPGGLPQGRFDTSYVFADTFTRAHGRNTFKAGGEYRHFFNDNFAEGTGLFNFPSVDAFLAGTANAFTIMLGRRRSEIDQRAFASFAQDQIAIRDGLVLDVGVRYEWHVTPTERQNRFVVFDAPSMSLVRVGVDVPKVYAQNAANIEPRAGVTWSLSPKGRTVLRAAYGRAADEPGTTAVRDTAGNPPFAVPFAATGSILLSRAIDAAQPAAVAPSSVDPGYRNATLDAWNVNLQRQFAPDIAATIGYAGAHGSNLRITRNINQPVGGERPFGAVAASSGIAPGAVLGNISEVGSTGFSNYHAVWVAVTKRQARGLQLDASYTWSKSLDTNSLNSSGFAIQDANNVRGEYGPSDFDARHRFVLSATCLLPFTATALTRGWRVAAVVQSQSGNPVNIVTSTSALNGTANTVRPDVTGPIRVIGSVDQWFDPSVFIAAAHFGNLRRNAVTGPGFNNADVAIIKEARAGPARLQFRADVFDVFNHPNFASPGNIVGSPSFGRITRTRLPTGEGGSSRQIQLSIRALF